MSVLSRPLSRFRRDESGAVAVEFALIAPLFFTLLFGIAVLGYFMGLSHSVHQLAAGAARASVAGLDSAERRALAEAYLAEAGSRYPLILPDALNQTVTLETGARPGITVALSHGIDGTLLELANGFLGLGLTRLEGSAYLAY